MGQKKVRYAKGKGTVKKIRCPVCVSNNCEEATRAEADLPKGVKRKTFLCYECGASGCYPPVR